MEIDSFLSYLKNIKRYSALTITAYKEDLNQFREFCEKVELIPAFNIRLMVWSTFKRPVIRFIELFLAIP